MKTKKEEKPFSFLSAPHKLMVIFNNKKEILAHKNKEILKK